MAIPMVSTFRTAYPEFDSPVIEDGPLGVKLRRVGTAMNEAAWGANYATAVIAEVAWQIASENPGAKINPAPYRQTVTELAASRADSSAPSPFTEADRDRLAAVETDAALTEVVVGPFTGTLAADQTDTQLNHATAGHEFVVMRAGSITGFSAQLSAAVTGADQDVTVEVAINGTPLAGGGTALAFTQAGAEVVASVTFAAGVHAVAAGDLVSVVYSSETITNTPTIVANVEITQ